MQDLTTRLAGLRRPLILVEAARLAAQRYDRERDLPVITGALPGRGAALMLLAEREGLQNAARLRGDTAYRASRHVRVLAALIAEHRASGDARAAGAEAPVT